MVKLLEDAVKQEAQGLDDDILAIGGDLCERLGGATKPTACAGTCVLAMVKG